MSRPNATVLRRAGLGVGVGLPVLLGLCLGLSGCSGGQAGAGGADGSTAAPASASASASASPAAGGPQPTLGPVSHGSFPELDAAAAALGGAWSRPEVRIHSACAEGGAEGIRTLAISRPQGGQAPSAAEASAAFAAAGLGSATPRGVAEGAVAIPAESDGVVEYGTFEGRTALVYVSRCDTVVG